MAFNFTGLGVNLQSFVKRVYDNLLYKSSSSFFVNEAYMVEARQTGAAVIDVTKQVAIATNNRGAGVVDIATALTPTLATYTTVQVNLTELPLDYSVRISPIMTTSNIKKLIEGQWELQESDIATKVDVYNYTKLVAAITGKTDGTQALTLGTTFQWSPATQQAYIDNITDLTAILFDNKLYEDYRCGLVATEYAKLTAALTSILKYETKVGVMGVDLGQVAEAYGVSFKQINSKVMLLADGTGRTKGFFANPVGFVGDFYFSTFNEWLGNYPGFPGYYVMEGNLTYGAQVIRPEAIIRLTSVAISA